MASMSAPPNLWHRALPEPGCVRKDQPQCLQHAPTEERNADHSFAELSSFIPETFEFGVFGFWSCQNAPLSIPFRSKTFLK